MAAPWLEENSWPSALTVGSIELLFTLAVRSIILTSRIYYVEVLWVRTRHLGPSAVDGAE